MKKKQFLSLSIAVGLLLLVFQNCQGSGSFVAKDMSSLSAPLSVGNAPVIQVTNPATLINKKSHVVEFTIQTAPQVLLKSATCQLDSAASVDCSNLSFSLGNLSEGDHIVKINAEDVLGQKAAAVSYSFRVDSVGPSVTVSQAPAAVSGSTAADFVFTANDTLSGVKQIECSLDNASFSVCTSPVKLSNLSVSSHNYRIRATDNAGNVGVLYNLTWVVSSSAPVINITSRPAAITNSQSASFVFSGTVGGLAITKFECSLDNAAFVSCTSPHALSGVSEGARKFSVRGFDSANAPSTPVTANWVVDITPPAAPQITTSTVNPTAVPSASFNFTSTDGGSGVASYQCSTDNAAFATCSSPRSLASVLPGAHSFRVKAIDGAGNESAVSSFNWTVTEPEIIWSVPAISFTVGSGMTYDLKTTLPSGVKAGGVFAVDSTGTQLPAGMTLSSGGVLAVGSAAETTLDNVIFSYTEP